jgi:hypothetical protein
MIEARFCTTKRRPKDASIELPSKAAGDSEEALRGVKKIL